MTLTQKETTLLSDLKSPEQLCVEKYNKYSQMAHDPELKNLFSTLSQNEQKHLDTVTQILNGHEVKMPEHLKNTDFQSLSFEEDVQLKTAWEQLVK